MTANGAGVVSHAGNYEPIELADQVGLTDAFSSERPRLPRRRRAHDPGAVRRDIAVSIADGGDCLRGLAVLHNQLALIGHVASVPTA